LAQLNLAACYYDGQGVSKDYVQAYRWWLLAAGHGNEVARKNVAIMEAKLTREQIAEGQNLAHNLKPRVTASEQDKKSPQ
jgi:TPR repeat protein